MVAAVCAAAASPAAAQNSPNNPEYMVTPYAFFSANALVMRRTTGDNRTIVVLENATGNNSNSTPVLTTEQLGTFGYDPGVEAKFGVRIMERWWGFVEFMHLAQDGKRFVGIGTPNGVGSSFALPFTRDISTHFDFATSVDVRQESRIFGTGIGAKFVMNEWLSFHGGFRYINLSEKIEIFAVDNASNGSGVYNLKARNDLFGGIFGATVKGQVLPRVLVLFSAGAGPFYNRQRVEHFVLDTQDASATRNETNRDSAFSVVAEGRLLAIYQVTPWIGLFAGYQAMFISNLALSQRELNFETVPGGTIARNVGVRGNGDVIYHGGTVGLKITW
jgi:hypothetical protein